MLTHHDSRTYEAAATEAGKIARDKMEATIAQGQRQAEDVLARIEQMAILDDVLAGRELEFTARDGAVKLNGRRLHSHALAQAIERTVAKARNESEGEGAVGKKVRDWAFQPDVAEEGAALLSKKYRRRDLADRVFLVRNVEDETRAVCSSGFRRIDARPMFAAAVEVAVKKHGAVPVEAHFGDLTASLKMVLPQVFEPIKNEPMLVGMVMRSSDFGAGKYWLRSFVQRLWCTNNAIAENLLSEVHLGTRLTKDLEFSERTYQLDTETMASATRDMVGFTFSRDNLLVRMKAIVEAAQNDPTFKAEDVIKELLRKGKVQKGEARQIAEAFSSAETHLLPAGATRYRLSQSIGLIAQRDVAPDRKLELEALAGAVAGIGVGE